MAFNIGNVVSPQVANALIRKGENRFAGGGIKRRDPIRRVERVDTTDRDQAEFDRLELIKQEAERRQANIDREFDFKERVHGDRLAEADKDRGAAGEAAKKKGEFDRNKALGAARDKVTKIVKDIGDTLAKAAKPNPDTGKPDPAAQAQAQKIVAALWQQITQMGLPPEELEALRRQIQGQNPSTPAARAPGGGIQRGAAAPGAPGAAGTAGAQGPAGLTQEHMQAAGRAWGNIVSTVMTGLHRQKNPSDEDKANARAIANGHVAEIMQLPLPPAKKREMLDGINRMYVSRGLAPLDVETILAQHGVEPGIQRGGENAQGSGGGQPRVESGLARELSTPTRTP